jgi:hypothetical protein
MDKHNESELPHNSIMKCISKPELANTTPLRPPRVNNKMNPKTNNKGVRNFSMLQIKLLTTKYFDTVGTAISL